METGEESLQSDKLAHDLDTARDLLSAYLHDEAQADTVGGGASCSIDVLTQKAFERFLASRETFRGMVSREQPHVLAAYSALEAATDVLCGVLREHLPPGAKDALIFNAFDRDLCFKIEPLGPEVARAHDRRGRTKADRFTSKHLEHAVKEYEVSAANANAAVKAALVELCELLTPWLPSLVSAATLGQLLVTAHAHVSHVARRGWSLPAMSEGSSLDIRVRPYWLEAGAVESDVKLQRRGAIVTGPNMSGKSTVMRAIGAFSILANCGFLCPGDGHVPRYRHVFFLVGEGDRPVEGISSFGQEAQLASTLLHRACSSTLALVDEFGRGTEPYAAQASLGALVEELSARRTHFVAATHLHDVIRLPLQLEEGQAAPALWRMRSFPGKEVGEGPRWTYELEEGTCFDSHASHALQVFGWTEEVLSRFNRLLTESKRSTARTAVKEVQRDIAKNRDSALESLTEHELESCSISVTDTGDCDGSMSDDDGERRKLHSRWAMSRALAGLCDVGDCSEAFVVQLSSSSMPPAAICGGAAVLYVICLKSGQLYVGQTDSLLERIAKHRQRFGEDIMSVLVLACAGTARSRQLETALQRRLLKEGVSLASLGDVSHVRFGLHSDMAFRLGSSSEEESIHGALSTSIPSVTSVTNTESLRNTARFLLKLADQLEGNKDLPITPKSECFD
eukprot:TRINITY_DN68186_c0_g1_i1.p1 TRINITY_DN68186_c0_g1~~TRINITY_DN68186_c0_g1_i1.p1  ORF type:complete len:743 (+),score=108.95 TRINITY_DN68186_c0_g1_i1:188-2230(+)